MNDHTPEPWRIGADIDGAIRIHGGDGPSLATVRYYSGNPRLNQERGQANAQLIVASPTMHEALWACRAWHVAENKNIGSFHMKTELCQYSEWATRRALAMAQGLEFTEEFRGVPRLILISQYGLDPRIERITEEQAKELVASVAEAEKEATRCKP